MSDRLQPRIYGSEIEYGYLFTPGKLQHQGGFASDSIRRCLPDGVLGLGQFLNNGARFYMDMGHPEYATPECATLDEIVAHELAGEEIVADTLERGEARNYIRNVQVNKRVADKGTEHWAAHENYFMSYEFSDDEILMPFATHFATRSVWAGAGMMKNGVFQVAQKMESIRSLNDGYAHSRDSRPLIDLRRSATDPLTQRSGGRRIHITCGDANVWPWAIRMKYGTTSLVMRLIEHNFDLSDLNLDDPVEAAQNIAADATLTRVVQTEEGKWVTALDIQEELAIRAQKLSTLVKLPQEELDVLEEWLRVCNDLRGNIDACAPRVEWVAKKQIIDGVQKRQGLERDDPTLATIDTRWDITSPISKLGYGVRLREAEKVEGLPDMAAIEKARTTPPETRAKIRGRFVGAMAMNKLQAEVAWDFLKIPGINRGHFRIDDPFRTKHYRLERALRKLSPA